MGDVIHCLRGTIWGQNYEKNMKTGRKYGEKEKMQILIKSLIFRTLQIYIFSFYAFLFFVSLADAEAGEDGGEDVGGGDGAGDFAEVVEGFAYVLGDEVA